MTETRIHNTNNIQETVTACRLFLSPREIEQFKELDYKLWLYLSNSAKLLCTTEKSACKSYADFILTGIFIDNSSSFSCMG